jgi:CheY-like chemotaxis protein
METKKILRGKRVLIVDDEKDILNVLVELLDMCRLTPLRALRKQNSCSRPSHTT